MNTPTLAEAPSFAAPLLRFDPRRTPQRDPTCSHFRSNVWCKDVKRNQITRAMKSPMTRRDHQVVQSRFRRKKSVIGCENGRTPPGTARCPGSMPIQTAWRKLALKLHHLHSRITISSEGPDIPKHAVGCRDPKLSPQGNRGAGHHGQAPSARPLSENCHAIPAGQGYTPSGGPPNDKVCKGQQGRRLWRNQRPAGNANRGRSYGDCTELEEEPPLFTTATRHLFQDLQGAMHLNLPSRACRTEKRLLPTARRLQTSRHKPSQIAREALGPIGKPTPVPDFTQRLDRPDSPAAQKADQPNHSLPSQNSNPLPANDSKSFGRSARRNAFTLLPGRAVATTTTAGAPSPIRGTTTACRQHSQNSSRSADHTKPQRTSDRRATLPIPTRIHDTKINATNALQNWHQPNGETSICKAVQCRYPAKLSRVFN